MSNFKKNKPEVEAPVAEAAPTNNALALFSGNALANPCATMVEEDGGAGFLPNFKIPFGIENLSIPVLDDQGQPMMRNGKPVMESATGKFVLNSGNGKIFAIPTPYLLSAYCIRGATRETLEKDGKKTYVRTLSKLGADANGKPLPPSAKHVEQVARGKKNGVDVGNISLVVCVFKDAASGNDVATVGLLESFKTMSKYYTDPLMHGLMKNKQGIVVSINDHNENNTKSGAGFFYYDARKFTQWQSVQLSDGQMELIRAALKDKADACNAWLNREE